MNSMNSKIGQKVKRYRLENNITQEALAEKLDVSVGYIAMLEGGKSGLKVNTFVKLCKVLNVTPNDLLQDFIPTTKISNESDKILNCVSKLDIKHIDALVKYINSIT